jgi:hypothetical protein
VTVLVHPGVPWPHGVGRPVPAGVAAALAFVLAVPLMLAGVAGLLLPPGGARVLLLQGCLACAAGLVAGGRALLARRGRRLLVASAVTGATASCLSWSLDPETASEGAAGLVWWVLVVLPLPVAVVALAATPVVGGWLRGDPVRPGPPTPPRPDEATTAAVLAAVVGGVVGYPTATVLAGGLASGDVPTVAEAVVVLVAAALVVGAVALLRRRSRVPLLVASAAGAVVACVVAATGSPGTGRVLVGLVLALLAAATVLALRPPVREWLATR